MDIVYLKKRKNELLKDQRLINSQPNWDKKMQVKGALSEINKMIRLLNRV